MRCEAFSIIKRQKRSTMHFPLTLSQYENIREIGSSAYSTVYAARCLTNGKLVAIKIIDLDEYPQQINEIREQMSDWSTISHINMMEYYGSFVEDKKLFIVTELIDNGSLLDIINFQFKKGIPDERLIASILHDVLSFLQFYHQRYRIHRCLETKTLLLSKTGSIKVGGFWNTRNLIQKGKKSSHRESRVEASPYTAPELVAGKKYQQSVDIWSLGIIAIELATGKAPFSDLEPLLQTKAIIGNPPPSLTPQTKRPNENSNQQTYSPLFCDFVSKCLQKDPLQRQSASELLKHKFLTQNTSANYLYFNLIIHLPALQDRISIQNTHSAGWKSFINSMESPSYIINFDFCGYDTSEKEIIRQPAQCIEIPKPDDDSLILIKNHHLIRTQSHTERKGRFLFTVT